MDTNEHNQPLSRERRLDIFSLEYAVQMIILLAIGLLAFAFL